MLHRSSIVLAIFVLLKHSCFTTSQVFYPYPQFGGPIFPYPPPGAYQRYPGAFPSFSEPTHTHEGHSDKSYAPKNPFFIPHSQRANSEPDVNADNDETCPVLAPLHQKPSDHGGSGFGQHDQCSRPPFLHSANFPGHLFAHYPFPVPPMFPYMFAFPPPSFPAKIARREQFVYPPKKTTQLRDAAKNATNEIPEETKNGDGEEENLADEFSAFSQFFDAMFPEFPQGRPIAGVKMRKTGRAHRRGKNWKSGRIMRKNGKASNNTHPGEVHEVLDSIQQQLEGLFDYKEMGTKFGIHLHQALSSVSALQDDICG